MRRAAWLREPAWDVVQEIVVSGLLGGQVQANADIPKNPAAAQTAGNAGLQGLLAGQR